MGQVVFPVLALIGSSFYLCRAGYAVEVMAVTFVFSLSALIVKGLENVTNNQSSD